MDPLSNAKEFAFRTKLGVLQSLRYNLSNIMISRSDDYVEYCRETARHARDLHDLALRGRDKKETTRLVHEHIIEAVELGPNDSLVDIGCGDGTLLRMARDLGVHHALGLLATEEEVLLVRKTGVHVQQGLSDQLPVADAIASVVVCNNVFLIVPRENIPASLREIWRIAKPGARIFIGEIPFAQPKDPTPNFSGRRELLSHLYRQHGLRTWFGMLRRMILWRLTGQPEVIRPGTAVSFFSPPEEFIGLATAAGLEFVRYWRHDDPDTRNNYIFRKPLGGPVEGAYLPDTETFRCNSASVSGESLHGSATEPVDSCQQLLRSRMPELDTIRGIAVLLVLFFHGFGLRYGLKGLSGFSRVFVAATLPGWVGVNLFFVLSGFLITGILLDSKPKADYYRTFYIRRALRILPLYYGVLLLLAVLTRTGWVNRHASWAFLGLSFFYLSNVTELLGVPMQYGVLWSLAVEEHFYLMWPAVVRSLSRQRVAIVGLVICILCPCMRAFYFIRGYDTGTGYTWLVADGLATGAVLAAMARGPWGARVRMWRVTLILFAASLLMFVVGYPFGIFRASRFLGMTLRETALNFFFAGMVAWALLAGTSRWKTVVNRPVLQFFGEISYGVYLIHMLVFDLEDHVMSGLFPGLSAQPGGHFGVMALFFGIAAGSTFAVAYLSRWYFEEPFLRLKGRFEGHSTESVVASEPSYSKGA